MKLLDRLIPILKKILETDDVEIKDCALQSLIEMIEEDIAIKKERFEKRNGN